MNTVANQLDTPQFRRFCRALIENYADLLEMLACQGARLCIVGVAGSPSCGVITTSSGYTGGLPGAATHTHVSGRDVAAKVEEVGKKEGTGGDS